MIELCARLFICVKAVIVSSLWYDEQNALLVGKNCTNPYIALNLAFCNLNRVAIQHFV